MDLEISLRENYEQTIKGFEETGVDCHSWDDIRVPAHIQMEGYDSPQYVNVQYPWDGREATCRGRSRRDLIRWQAM